MRSQWLSVNLYWIIVLHVKKKNYIGPLFLEMVRVMKLHIMHLFDVIWSLVTVWASFMTLFAVMQILLCFCFKPCNRKSLCLWNWACNLRCQAMSIYNHVLTFHWFMDDFVLQLYVHSEKFNQPIFFCNNISGQVEPVSNQWEF